jgi:hypothetical protein
MPRQRETEPQVTIDDMSPKNTGFVESYKATWQEAGVVAGLWLDVVDPDHWQQGHYLPAAYELTAHIETVSGRPLGALQEEKARGFLQELRTRMLAAMTDAGWQQVGRTRDGQPIYQYRGPWLRLVVPDEDQAQETARPDLTHAPVPKLPSLDQQLQVLRQVEHTAFEPRRSHVVDVIGSAEAKVRGQEPAYHREVWTRPITFTCVVCGDTVTQQRYPGHTPLYCSDTCKEERVAAKTRERVARHREKKKAEEAARHSTQETP